MTFECSNTEAEALYALDQLHLAPRPNFWSVGSAERDHQLGAPASRHLRT